MTLTNCLNVSTIALSGAVQIPVTELRARTQELPRAGHTIRVFGEPDDVFSALQILDELDRPAEAGTVLTAVSNPRLWSPNSLLEEVAEKLRPGSALDLGCGGGREAVHLTSKGWKTTAVDWLDDALEMGKNLQTRYAPEAFPIDWRRANLDSFNIEDRFDLITMFFFLDRELLKRSCEWLAPGGSLVLETFTERHRRETGKPRREHLVLKERELMDLLPDLDVISYEEDCQGERHTARYWGKLR